MKLSCAFLLCLSIEVHRARSFSLHHRETHHSQSTVGLRTNTVLFSSSSSFDYEYIPPNPDASPDQTNPTTILSSSYTQGTPAGLRGEAVRSALLSGRCIGWELSSDPSVSMGGVLQIQGKGMMDFLNNKLTQEFTPTRSYQEACLLDAKGRVVDRLRVSIINTETALIMTSPGHSSQQLLERLDPFIFPMDQVSLKNYSDQAFVFTLASTQWTDVQKVLEEQALPKTESFPFPSQSQCAQWKLDNDVRVLVIPSTGLPSVACVGYTFVFYSSNAASAAGSKMWHHLISEENQDGPIHVGALEYETLRIESGQPAYGKELDPTNLKTSPLELHWQDAINFDKGCYLGQEGIASIVKNIRGPPRTLYAVVFDDEFNIYESQSQGDNSDFENLTKLPQPGQTLYALGSNEELSVGTLTSVAESSGTGERNTVGLALVRRADSIMKQMKQFDLEIPRDMNEFLDVDMASGMIEPPPLDPLEGLEVIVEGTFTMGVLKMIPSRGLRKGRNLFDETIVVKDLEETLPTKVIEPSPIQQDESSEADLEQLQAEAEKAAAEAEAAAAEARRKAEKMELLKKRAEEAMARRKKKQQ